MPGTKLLVFGGTGPAGICLLRELVHRNIPTIAYVRNPTKIPAELAESSNLEIIKGEIDDKEALTAAISKSKLVISILGPNQFRVPPTLFQDFYRTILTILREHNVKRIFAMGTISIPQPQDQFSFLPWILVWLVYLVGNLAYQNILGVAKVFEEEAQGLDWTIFRIAGIPGGSDEESWKKDREQEAVAGSVGDATWGITVKRGALARWLVDEAVREGTQWIGKLPTVSGRGERKKTL